MFRTATDSGQMSVLMSISSDSINHSPHLLDSSSDIQRRHYWFMLSLSQPNNGGQTLAMLIGVAVKAEQTRN